LSAGVGITTDGDLIHFSEDVGFDRFKLYSTNAPKYPSLYLADDSMITAYECVVSGETDVLAKNLSSFNTQTGSALTDMTAVLLVESYIKDDDLCTGTDCDNRGQDYISKSKLLLIKTSDIDPLIPSIKSAEAAAAALPELVARRVLINSARTTSTQINSRFVSASKAMLKDINAAFATLWNHAGFLFDTTFDGDPSNGWITRLNNISSTVSNTTQGTQYYYDFIKDIIETWNHMRTALATEIPWCCPDINGFPKHLLLGDMSDNQRNRFDFYRSAALVDDHSLKHGQFLAKKINELINNFSLPQTGGEIRVTPSAFCRSLEERAIPFYYRVDAERSIVKQWNFHLSQRDMSSYNYAYHHARYAAKGAAADPLQSTIDQHDFFRIEGHIGQSVTTALTTIESEISEFNLPFTVTSVLLGTSRNGIIGRRGAGYTDLTRFHHLLRKDLSLTMKDVSTFNNKFKIRIDQAIISGTVKNDTTGSDGAPIKIISDSKHTTINTKSAAVQNKMNLSYADYRKDSSWKMDIADAMTFAGEYKLQLSKVVKTEFVTPFDSLIGSTRVDWLDWLDVLIDDKDKLQDEKRLLREFIKRYPGMEHNGGVIRGGTFVLLYNSSGNVVADFMLSHYLHDETEEEREEPSLPTPGIRPGWVIDSGINILPSLDNYLDIKLGNFKTDINKDWTQKFNIQTSYTTAFQDSIGMMTEIFTKPSKVTDTARIDKYQDATLGLLTEITTRDQKLVKDYTEKANDTTLPQETRDYYGKALGQKQNDLAKSATGIAEHISVTGTDVKYGSEGYRALQEVTRNKELIKDNDVANTLMTEGIKNIQTKTSDAVLSQGLDAILKFGLVR
ncbi:hypothetical protein JYT26_02695, partial [Beggiatoa alba]|nr:hypothetical protein [Beggiatoa alba]